MSSDTMRSCCAFVAGTLIASGAVAVVAKYLGVFCESDCSSGTSDSVKLANSHPALKSDLPALIEMVILSRRSIFPKDYSQDRKVPKYVVEKLLELANWAPSHGRTEPWRFIVFSGKQLADLGRFEAEWYKSNTAPEKFSQAKYEKKYNNKVRSSFVVAICLHRQESRKIPEIEEIEAVACAVQNMHLAATCYDVAAYWSSGGCVYSEEMKKYLGLRGDDKCLGMFHLGYSDGRPKSSTREPISQKITWRDH